MDEETCLVFEVLRGTTHDGPGVRTTVFLKGCPLECRWCQNPEGIHPGQEIWWDGRKCITCLACRDACPCNAIAVRDDGLEIDRQKCTVCGSCVSACPSGAMAFAGTECTIDQIVQEVQKDRDYYEGFGGGVTVSGGEPLLHHRFVSGLLRRLKESGIRTAVDTCGFADAAVVDSVLPHADCVLYDVKFIDADLHDRYTGQSNGIILSNLAGVADYIRSTGGRKDREADAGEPHTTLWIRTPLIPDATATDENIRDIGRYLCDTALDVTERWELCTFNQACASKYRKMGRQWAYENRRLMGQDSIHRLKTAALSTGFPEERLVVSGLIAEGPPNRSW